MLRLPALFGHAQQYLGPDLWQEADEPHLRVIWRTARDVVNTQGLLFLSGSPEQAHNMLQVEARAYAQSHQSEITEEYDERLDEFFRWAYEGLSAAELRLEYGLDLLKRFLAERAVVDPLSRMLRSAGSATITNLPALLTEVQERHAAVERIGGGPRSLADDWDGFQAYLGAGRGHTLIGLRTGMPWLDEYTLGLRDFIGLGAMPGIGKTAWLLQLGLNVLRHNGDAIFVAVSLEMPRYTHYTRLLCSQAGMDWKTVRLGSPSLRGSPNGPWFTPEDHLRRSRGK